jgi:ribulose-phosphate 3-epimerase
MGILAPSILAADFTNLEQQIKLVEEGGADWIHCDIMDGHFVPNITFGPLVVESAKRSTNLPLDVHLMIENPDNFLEDFIKAGADYLSVHIEVVEDLKRTIRRIKELGAKAGVVINPATPVSSIKSIANQIDLFLIMTVNAGFGGQEFIPNSLQRINEAVDLRKESGADFLIEIDGGVNVETARQAFQAGAEVFVAGTSIFNAENITEAVREIKTVISK